MSGASSSFAGETVSLASAVNVAILNAQRGLQALTVELVSKRDAERKEALVKFCERTRHELLRLFVVVRWLGALPHLQRVWRAFELLFRVDGAMRATADALFYAQSGLASAQAPLFDVRAALDVLARGTYSGLPRSIDAVALGPALAGSAGLMDAEMTASVLRRLEHAIHMRLLASPAPREAGHLRVERGRLLLRVERAYVVALTLDSDEPAERWRVLEVRLLVATAASRLLESRDEAAADVDAIVASSVPLPALQRLHATLQLRIDAAPPDDGLLTVHATLMPLCTELCVDALHEQARRVRRRVGRALQLEYDRDALLVQYWCADSAAADDAADDAAAAAAAAVPGQFSRSASTVALRSTSSLLKMALDSHAATPAATAHARGGRGAAQLVPAEGEFAFCVSVRNNALTVTHVPPLPPDATTAHLVDGALKRLDFVALLRHVIDARALQSLMTCSRAISHVLAQQLPTQDEPLVRAAVTVLRATSGAATADSAPPRLLMQLDGKSVCVLLRDRLSGAVLASETAGDLAAFITPAWWQAALRVGLNDAGASDEADMNVVQLGCLGLWSRAALDELRQCACARGSLAAHLQPNVLTPRTLHKRQSLLIQMRDTYLAAFVRIVLDDALQPAAQLVLTGPPTGAAATPVAGAASSSSPTPAPADFGAASEFGERLVRCTPLNVVVSAASGTGSGERRRRRLNADDAWVAAAVAAGEAVAWNADFDAQLARAGVAFERYTDEQRTFTLKFAGRVPVRVVATNVADEAAVEWRVELGVDVSGAREPRTTSAALHSHDTVRGCTVWRYSRAQHAERGVVRTGLLAAHVAVAVANVKRAAANRFRVEHAGDIGVQLALADGSLRVLLAWRAEGERRSMHASAVVETSDAALDRVFGPALQALLGDVDARVERHAGVHVLLMERLTLLGPLARALDELRAFGDVRVLVLSLLGQVSVLVLVRQQFGVLVRTVDGRTGVRLSDAATDGAPLMSGLTPWSGMFEATSAVFLPCSAADVAHKLLALRGALAAFTRLADVGRALASERDTSVQVTAGGRRVAFTTPLGSQAFDVTAEGALSLQLERDGVLILVPVAEIDDAAATVRSVMALLNAVSFLPPALVKDVLNHLSGNVAMLLLAPPASDESGGVGAVVGVQSEQMYSRLRMALRYADARSQQRTLVLELSGETGAWVWSYAKLTRGPLQLVNIDLFDNTGQRKLSFLDNFLEAKRANE